MLILIINICLSKWSQISSQYLANNAFVSVGSMIFTSLSQISSQESDTYQRNSIYHLILFLSLLLIFFPI